MLCVSVARNEMLRFPFFLKHYRALGVRQFLIVDNGSDDGTTEFLLEQDDVSLWRTEASYRAARFGVDWQNWLLCRYAHRHWTITVDIDELLVFSDTFGSDLTSLGKTLDRIGQPAFGALMLDLFAKDGPPTDARDPIKALGWFDAGPFRASRQSPLGNLWVQGGTRERVFFSDCPRASPTLNKIPFVRWNRRYAYVNATHSVLPRSLNGWYDGPGDARPCGALLHTKFLPDAAQRAKVEKTRGEHFHNPAAISDYYDAVMSERPLWHTGAEQYDGIEMLAKLGLVSR